MVCALAAQLCDSANSSQTKDGRLTAPQRCGDLICFEPPFFKAIHVGTEDVELICIYRTSRMGCSTLSRLLGSQPDSQTLDPQCTGQITSWQRLTPASASQQDASANARAKGAEQKVKGRVDLGWKMTTPCRKTSDRTRWVAEILALVLRCGSCWLFAAPQLLALLLSLYMNITGLWDQLVDCICRPPRYELTSVAGIYVPAWTISDPLVCFQGQLRSKRLARRHYRNFQAKRQGILASRYPIGKANGLA